MARKTATRQSTTGKTTRKPTAIDQARTPLLVAIGAGELALSSVREAVTDARTRAEERVEHTIDRVTSIPEEIDELRSKLAPEELRRVAEAYVQAAASIYVGLAERGGDAVSRVRRQPPVDEVFGRAAEAREDAKDLTDEVLGTVARQTRSIGERAARATEKATDRATSTAGKAGAAVSEAGEDAAHELRSVSRTAANRTSSLKSSTLKSSTLKSSTPKSSARSNPRQAAAKKTTAAKGTERASTAKAASTAADVAATTVTDTKDTVVAAQKQATEATS